MKSFKGAIIVAASCGVLAGCGLGLGKAKAPTGQVLATVGNHEITVRDLRAEMGSSVPKDPSAAKAAEQSALQTLIGRYVIAQAAREQGLDKTPDFALQKDRAMDALLVQSLQQKLIKEIPQPTKEEVQSFISAHPDIFAERKVFALDQIRMARPSDPKVLKALVPLKTLEQVQAVLTENKVPFQRAQAVLDAVGADPRLIDAIMKLPPDEIFVLPGGGGLLVNQIKETKVVPFTGDQAEAYATQVMMKQRTQESIQKAFSQITSKAAPTIHFNKDYAVKAGAAPAPATPGPAPAPSTAKPVLGP